MSVNFASITILGLTVTLIAVFFMMRRQSRHIHTRSIRIESLQRRLRYAEAQIERHDQALRTLIDASFDCLIVIDRRRHVTLINRAARLFFNVPEVPDHPLTLIEVTRQHILENLVARAVESHEQIEDQLDIDGRSFKVRAVSANDEALIIMEDVTDLLRLTRARRDMVANISHELRTPISTIRLLVDTLNQKVERGQTIDAKPLRKISAETDSLQNLVQELHDLSMIESGRALLRLIELPLSAIVSDALGRMTSQIEKKKISVVNQVADSLRVLADPDQTRRVLTNLISNAVKFTPVNGTITFDASERDELVTMRVSDTGIGIPTHERKRVFERFYQIDNARTNMHGGTGLGLSIARHIVEAQGGTIWVEGVDPQGACLCFTLSSADRQNVPEALFTLAALDPIELSPAPDKTPSATPEKKGKSKKSGRT